MNVHSWYYWEFIIYFETILMMTMITYMNDYNEGIQICILFATLFICQLIHIINKPYYTEKLNSLQALSLLVCLMFYLARLMIRTFGLHVKLDEASSIVSTITGSELENEPLVDIRRIPTAHNSDVYIYIVCVLWIGLFLFAVIYFVYNFYIHLMLFFIKAEQQKIFKFLTCGKSDIKTFLDKHSTQERIEAHIEDVLDQNEVEAIKERNLLQARKERIKVRRAQERLHGQGVEKKLTESSEEEEDQTPADGMGEEDDIQEELFDAISQEFGDDSAIEKQVIAELDRDLLEEDFMKGGAN